MDYKKEYEAMMQRARELHEGGNALTKKQMEIVCPELAESEDERIRKELIAYLESDRDSLSCQDISFYERAIAYLEKQKINTEGDFARGYDCGYQCCLNSHGAEWFEKQKERKPVECIKFDKEFENQVSHLKASVLNGEYEYSEGFVDDIR